MTQKIFTIKKGSIIAIFTRINQNIGTNSTIAQLYICKEDFTTIPERICGNMPGLDINSLFLVKVNKSSLEETFTNQPEIDIYNDPRLLKIIYINDKKLSEIMSTINNNDGLNNTLFIFEDYVWAEVLEILKFSDLNLTVTGGTNNKRHVISTSETKLVVYLLILFNFNINLINAYNWFDTAAKEMYLPFFDFSNKNEIRFTDIKQKLTILKNINKKPHKE